MTSKLHSVGLVDDHTLFRKGMISLIDEFPEFYVRFEADNGIELKKLLHPDNEPDIMLLDVNMPGIDGVESMIWLSEHFPLIKVLALSMINQEATVINMLKAGAKGYMLKDAGTQELHKALMAIANDGNYYSPNVTTQVIHHLKNGKPLEPVHQGLNDREREFLRFVCTEMTYKEIAENMHLSSRTIEGYRDSLFDKLNCKNRTGLVLFAIREGIYRV
jgi:two-component system, NarL family, invasion response regulator UvrY